LLDSIENIKPERDAADVLFEIMLKLGLDLCASVEARTINGMNVYAVGGGVLVACLAERIERAEVEPLARSIVEWIYTMNPASRCTCAFRDSAFVDDVAKSNMAATLEQHGIAEIHSL
jgi:adenine-specific DNA-methyltransferase